jgi:putative hydrolases of HD superfamily
MDYDRFYKQLEFLTEIDKMKQIFRNTILMDDSRRENDAEHTWHMAVCSMLFIEYANEKDLDMLKVLKMIMIHDVVEIDAGDTFAYDDKGHIDKAEREQKAALRLFGLLPDDQRDEFMELWNEFEEYETPESKYACLVDTFMPIYHNYKTKGLQWQRLNVTSDKVLTRNSHIQCGSEEMWEYVQSIVKDAVEKGYLKP